MRFLLKLSGEALTEPKQKGLRYEPVQAIIRETKSVQPEHQPAIVVGGGNIDRGSDYMRHLHLPPEAQVHADWAGMLATYINGGLLATSMELAEIDVRLMLAKSFGDVGETFYHNVARSHLEKGRVIIMVGGVGRPGFSTDTGAVVGAMEINAAMVLKGTKVDGIYDHDPVKHPDAKRLPRMTYAEFLGWEDRHGTPLGIMDTTAVAMARNFRIPIRVFNIFEPGSLARVLRGEGTYSEISS